MSRIRKKFTMLLRSVVLFSFAGLLFSPVNAGVGVPASEISGQSWLNSAPLGPDWTDPPTIEWAVRYIQDSRARRREGLQLAPFYAEIAGYRWNSPAKVMEGLVRAGPKAVADYKRAMQRKQNQGATPGRIEIDE